MGAGHQNATGIIRQTTGEPLSSQPVFDWGIRDK